MEGRNIAIEQRFSEGKYERLPALAADLVRVRVNVIVTYGTVPTQAAMHATTTIPIVMANSVFPVETGLVASLAQPGGNVTGVAAFGPEQGGKALAIFKEAVPGLSRLGVFWDPENPAAVIMWRQTQVDARALGGRAAVTVSRRGGQAPDSSSGQAAPGPQAWTISGLWVPMSVRSCHSDRRSKRPRRARTSTDTPSRRSCPPTVNSSS